MLQWRVMERSRGTMARDSQCLPGTTARWVALAAAVAVHALALSAWMRSSAPQKPARPEISRQRSAVSLLMTPRSSNSIAPDLGSEMRATRTPYRNVPLRRKTLVTTEPTPYRPAEPLARLPPVRQETPTASPGTAFASLFAPVMDRPLGRSTWNRSATAPQPANIDATAQREQALLELRSKVSGRLRDLADRLAMSGQVLRCSIAVDTAQRLAEVHCDEPGDQAAPWAALQGLLVAGAVSRAQMCFRVEGAMLHSGACDVLAAPSP